MSAQGSWLCALGALLQRWAPSTQLFSWGYPRRVDLSDPCRSFPAQDILWFHPAGTAMFHRPLQHSRFISNPIKWSCSLNAARQRSRGWAPTEHPSTRCWDAIQSSDEWSSSHTPSEGCSVPATHESHPAAMAEPEPTLKEQWALGHTCIVSTHLHN